MGDYYIPLSVRDNGCQIRAPGGMPGWGNTTSVHTKPLQCSLVQALRSSAGITCPPNEHEGSPSTARAGQSPVGKANELTDVQYV